jgi:excisionase family DNA binding protein
MNTTRQPDSAPPPPPLCVTIQQAAALLNVSERTVWRLVQAGTLPSVKVATARRIRYHDVQAYLDQQVRADDPTRQL